MKPLSISRSNLPRSGIREIMELSSELSDVIHLEVGEPNVDTPLHIREAAVQAMHSGFTHYTPNAGLSTLRSSIVRYLNKQYAIDVDADQIVVTPGAVTALAVTLLALVDTKEEVLLPDPGWPNYEQMVNGQGAIPIRYPLNPEHGFVPNVEELEKLVTHKTKAIMINSPGNPTGGVLEEKHVREIVAFASKHDLYVISDEVYDGIVFEGEHVCPLTFDQENRVISIFGFSKSYAMTGWRVGYAVAPSPIAAVMAKLLEPIVSCASSVSQKAAEEAINGPQDFVDEMREEYKSRRDKAVELFSQEYVKVYLPKGAFYMLVDFSQTALPCEEFALTLLKEEKVAVAPGTTFGQSTKNMVRISLATEEANLLEGVKRICNFIHRHKGKTT